MKRKKKNLIISGLLIFSLASCGGSDSSQSEVESSSDVVNEVVSTDLGDDFSEHMTVEVSVVDTDKQDKDQRYDFIKEKFNMDFNLVACSEDDVNEKNRIWIASGDLPEVMWSQIGPKEARTWIDSQQLRAFDLTNYPNLKASQDNIRTDDLLLAEDGSRYFIATAFDTSDIDYKKTVTFGYRKDWAKELGLYNENDEYTWDEMLEMADAMVKEDPGNNGDGKTIGLVTTSILFPGYTGVIQSNPNWQVFYNDGNGYKWGAEEEATIEGIKLAKAMYDSGILWEEQALGQINDGPAKFNSGQAGIMVQNFVIHLLEMTLNGLKETYPDKDINDMFGIMKVKMPNSDTYFTEEAPDSWGQICFRSDVSDEKVHRVLSWLDYMVSEEGKLLQQYGVEGGDYNVAEDGTIEMLWEKDENGEYVSPYALNSDRLLSFAELNEFKKATLAYTNKDVAKFTNDVADYVNNENAVVKLYDYERNVISGEVLDKSTLEEDLKNKVVELIMTSNDIEGDYRAWIAEQQDEKNAIIDELNAGIQ
ncbi:MAG: hypothetical protein ACK5LT_10060 [Lachnospirales bacterium]